MLGCYVEVCKLHARWVRDTYQPRFRTFGAWLAWDGYPSCAFWFVIESREGYKYLEKFILLWWGWWMMEWYNIVMFFAGPCVRITNMNSFVQFLVFNVQFHQHIQSVYVYLKKYCEKIG